MCVFFLCDVLMNSLKHLFAPLLYFNSILTKTEIISYIQRVNSDKLYYWICLGMILIVFIIMITFIQAGYMAFARSIFCFCLYMLIRTRTHNPLVMSTHSNHARSFVGFFFHSIFIKIYLCLAELCIIEQHFIYVYCTTHIGFVQSSKLTER